MTQKLIAYKRMPIWTKDTMPEALQKAQYQGRNLGKDYSFKGSVTTAELTEEGKNASHLF